VTFQSALIRCAAPTAAALISLFAAGLGARPLLAAPPAAPALTAKAALPTVLLYPATAGDVAALVDLRTRLRLDGRVEVLTYDPESAAIQRASAEDAHPEWLVSAPATDAGRMLLARALGAAFYAVVSPGRAADSTHVELVETAPAARTFDWTGSNRQFGVRAMESQVADSISHPVSNTPASASPASPSPVSPAPAPAVVASAPAPAVVASAPAPAVVASAPAPAVVASAPAPIVIALPKPLPPVPLAPVPLIPKPPKSLAAILPPGVVPFVPTPPVLPVILPSPVIAAPPVIATPLVAPPRIADMQPMVVPAVPVSPLLPSARMADVPPAKSASPVAPAVPAVTPPSKGTQIAALPKETLPAPLSPLPITPTPITPSPPIASPSPPIASAHAPKPALPAVVKNTAPKAEDISAIQPLLAKGDAALDGGDAVSAIALYRQAINGAPLSVVPRLKLAQAYQKDGLNDRALDEARRALEIAPDSGPVQQFLSDLDQQTGTTAGTLIRDRAALERNPDSPAAHSALADALWNNGDLAGAEAEYKSAQVLAPAGDHAVDAHLAQLYAAEARYDDCLAALGTAGKGGYALAAQIVKNRAETLSSTLSTSRETFAAGKSTREQFYDDAKKLSAEAQALAGFVAKVSPPAEYKLAHLHRMLATNLLAQEAATLVTYIETGDPQQNDSLSQLERAAATEMLTAQATEEKLGLWKDKN
jgi:Tfp pilus assembly protein PilF